MEAPKRSRINSASLIVKKDKDTLLDAGIWGELQYHIDLRLVYEKLPFEELFQLRAVCKAWNYSASQRLEINPYFVIIPPAPREELFLNGVLTYDVTSETYSFQRQRFFLRNSPSSYAGPIAVEGLLFCHHPDNSEKHGVFNIHTKIWYAIPPPPKESKYRSAVGMMVDTSQRPYSFKLVVGSVCTKTQIYDSQSRSWSTTSSLLTQLAKPALSRGLAVTCMFNEGHIYISLGAVILLMYSIEEDTWSILNSPPVILDPYEDTVHALGVWEGRIFTTRKDYRKTRFTVWELVDRKKQKWVEYAVMSEQEYMKLMMCYFRNHGHDIFLEMIIVPCFCNGYLLVYNWQYLNAQSEALMMLNLATKEWKLVDLRPGTVALMERLKEDSNFEEATDERSVVPCRRTVKVPNVEGSASECSDVEGGIGERHHVGGGIDIKDSRPPRPGPP